MSVKIEYQESLGKLAYEVYCDAIGWKSVQGEALPQWEDQRKNLQAGWCAAAAAIAELFECGGVKEENQ